MVATDNDKMLSPEALPKNLNSHPIPPTIAIKGLDIPHFHGGMVEGEISPGL